MKSFFLLITITLFFSACSQKVQIRSLVPAEIDRAASTKKISVSAFENDIFGLSSKIEYSLASKRIDNQNFFTIISRRDFEKIINEQKLQNSGLVDSSTVVEAGRLIGAQAIISGEVEKLLSKDSYYKEKRTKCVDKKCKETLKYKVSCTKREVTLSAKLKMVDVQMGDIIYAQKLSKYDYWTHCSDDEKVIPSKSAAGKQLATSIANSFTYKMTPHYRYESVVLLEDADLDYSDYQERLLENSLIYIKQSRYDKAEQLLVKLIDSTDKQSYVSFYNLGVVREAQGDYRDAQEYYKVADNLMIEPVEEISKAIIRIKSVIYKHQKTQEQLQR
jgi:tetratricopeptide (TPR) repeat protein